MVESVYSAVRTGSLTQTHFFYIVLIYPVRYYIVFHFSSDFRHKKERALLRIAVLWQLGLKIVLFESGTLSFLSCAKRQYWRQLLPHLGMSGRHSVARIEGGWDTKTTKNK